MKAPHSTAVSLTTVLLALISVWQLAGPLVPGRGQIPQPVVIGAVVLGIAVAGLWTGKPWVRPLATVVAAISGLGALPGIAFAPNALLHISAKEPSGWRAALLTSDRFVASAPSTSTRTL
jgi:hypothetical protein